MPETLSSREVRDLTDACRRYEYFNIETRVLKVLLDAYHSTRWETPTPVVPVSAVETEIDRYLSEAAGNGDLPVRILLSTDRLMQFIGSPLFDAATYQVETRRVGAYRGVPVFLTDGTGVVSLVCASTPAGSAPPPAGL